MPRIKKSRNSAADILLHNVQAQSRRSNSPWKPVALGVGEGEEKEPFPFLPTV